MKAKIAFLIITIFIIQCTIYIENCMSQWVQVSSGLGNEKVINALVLKGSNIFAGVDYDGGVWLTSNYGTNWSQTALNNKIILSLATNGNNIYAGTSFYYGVYLSTNNGTNWTQSALNNQTAFCLATNGSVIFVGSTNGLYNITIDGTASAQTSLPSQSVYSLAVSGNNIFAGTYSNGVYLSTDNGTNWVQTSLNTNWICCLAVSGSKIFAGTSGNGVYISTNSGTNWTQTSLNNKNVKALVINGNNVFAGTATNGVFVSTNNGTNWTQKNEGFTFNLSVLALLIVNEYIYAGSYGGSVYRRLISNLLLETKTISSEISTTYSLEQNYPNPFNPNTIIKFSIPENGKWKIENGLAQVTLKVYNILGKEVATLVNEKLKAGEYEVSFDGSDLSSGIYFYKLEANNFSDIKRMILIK